VPQIVYVLTNPAMPDLIKIGVTARSEVNRRIAELSRPTGVPLPFECHYAGEVGNHNENVEHLIQRLFAKSRVAKRKEFFRIAPEEAVYALRLARAKDVTPQFQKKHDAEGAKAIEALERGRRRNTVFSEVGIAPGTQLTLSRGKNVKCTVVEGNKVKFKGRVMSSSAAAVKALQDIGYTATSVSGPNYWTLRGKTVFEIAKRKRRKRQMTGTEENL
jgi:hypothetical protein